MNPNIDYCDLNAVIALAEGLVKKFPKFKQYIVKDPGRVNYNITMKPGPSDIVLYEIDRKTTLRCVADLKFKKELNDLWVRYALAGTTEHDILITKMDREYEVFVHEPGTGDIIAGPFRSFDFDSCAVWAKSRAGIK